MLNEFDDSSMESSSSLSDASAAIRVVISTGEESSRFILEWTDPETGRRHRRKSRFKAVDNNRRDVKREAAELQRRLNGIHRARNLGIELGKRVSELFLEASERYLSKSELCDQLRCKLEDLDQMIAEDGDFPEPVWLRDDVEQYIERRKHRE